MAVPVIETSHRTTKDYHSTSGSLTITTPASGELIVVVAACATASYYTNVISCSGYTKVTEYAGGSDAPNVALFWKVSDGTETSVAITTTQSAENAIQAFILSGADTTSPIDVHSEIASSFRVTSTSVRQVTTTVANTLAIGCDMSIGDQTTWNGGINGDYSPWTYLGSDEGSAIGDFDISAVKYSMASAGATPTASFTHYQYILPCILTFAVKQAPTVVSVTGSSATGGVGSVTTSGGNTTSVTGVSATGHVGTAPIHGKANVYPTAPAATGGVGTVAVSGDFSMVLTGVSATGQVGSVTASLGVGFNVTGLSGTGQVGSASVGTGSGVYVNVTGVSSTASVGTVNAAAAANAAVTGLVATGATNGVSLGLGATVYPTGLEASTYVGQVNIFSTGQGIGNALGQVAYGQVGVATVIEWHGITSPNNPGFSDVAPTQNPNWKEGSIGK